MAEATPLDPFISSEEEVQVDAKTAVAILEGIRAADEGRLVSSEDVRKRLSQWLSKSSTLTQP